ncbi:MAG: methyltransferase domain-containing protein [Vicinamibacteria bacterium]
MDERRYKDAVAEAFDEAAEGYDLEAMRFFDNAAEELARSLPLGGGERVLDAATGTGKVAVAVARRLATGSVTGIDLSAGMLARAGRRAERAGVRNVDFQRCDVDEARLSPASFDGLTCAFGVHFWSDMERSLGGILRAVREGGFVAIASFAKGSFEPEAGICLRKFAEFGVKLPEVYSYERLDHPEKVARLLQAVGLRDCVTRTFQAGHDLASPGDWWDLVRYTGFRAFLNQLTADEAARYRDEFLSAVAASAGGRRVVLNVEVILATAVR